MSAQVPAYKIQLNVLSSFCYRISVIMSIIPNLTRRELGLKNVVKTTVLKRKLFDKYFKDCLFDCSLMSSLYYTTYNLCISYPFICAYISEKIISSPCTCGEFNCTCDCFVIFVNKLASHYNEYDFLLEDLQDIADATKADFYSID